MFLSGAKLLEILDPWVCVSHVSSEGHSFRGQHLGTVQKDGRKADFSKDSNSVARKGIQCA